MSCVSDFAVGAPFHESGSVMIWTGSSKGISTEPAQVWHTPTHTLIPHLPT